MRQGELKELHWKKIDLDSEKIRLEGEDTKNKTARTIPYGVLPELARFMNWRKNGLETVLVAVKWEMKLWDLDEEFVFLLYGFGGAGSAVAAGAQNVQTYFDALNHGGSFLYRAPKIFANL
jgi:hypothetical protein